MAKEDLVGEHPISAGLAVFTLSTIAWVAVSAVFRGDPDPLTTLLFAGTFTVVYVGFTRYGPLS